MLLRRVLLDADPATPQGAATKQYVDAATAPLERVSNKSVSGTRMPNGYIGADANGNVPSSLIYSATPTAYGLVRLTGDLGGTGGTPTVPGLALKAPIDSPVFTGAVTLPGNPVSALQAVTKQYVDTPSIVSVGNLSGTWIPDPTIARQIKGIVTGALTIQAPTTGLIDGWYSTLVLWSTAASQTITIDGGMSVMAGYPASFQTAPNKLNLVTLRYSTDFARWTCTSIQQEG